jgi:serine/threonine protein kinase
MATTRICKQCQQPLPENAPEGLCPPCLAKAGLGSEPAGPRATINVNPLGEAAAGTRVPPEVAQLAAQFPQLEIIELLGMGGMGMVYKARQLRVDRLVALKILPVESSRSPSFAERFQREAKALAKLNHPGIVTFYDFGQTSEYYYFIMEYVDGMNLRQLLQSQSIEPRQALELVTQICTALQFAHDEGVVHRDIKPENILINKKGQVKIADFGLAKLLGTAPDTALTMSQAAMGTFNYMAPEQRENAHKVDHRADIYSLGVVFYEMLTGEVPMGRFDPPSKKVQVDVRLDEVVLRALEREPERRYQHVSEVKTGVDTLTSTMPRAENSASPPEPLKRKPPPPFGKYVVIPCAALALAWLGVGLWLRGGGGDGIPAFDVIWWVLPVGLATIVYVWLDARERSGLRLRQFPPCIRRSMYLWTGAATATYILAVLITLFFVLSSSVFVTKRQTKSAEWWFCPNSGQYERLGLSVTFPDREQKARLLPNQTLDDALARGQAWRKQSNCTFSLVIYRKNGETNVMTVIAPGLRAAYRAPTTNSWDYNAILDRDTLIDWLHNDAGLDPAAPQFSQETSEIYTLLRAYQNEPPQTTMEFVNLAKADLRDFWVGGARGESVSYTAEAGFFLIGLWLLAETLLYIAFGVWLVKRFSREAWTEIDAGRWTPPSRPPARFPTALKVLCGLILLSLAGALGSVCLGIKDVLEGLLWMAGCLGIILVSCLQIHSHQQIQLARQRGLWPLLGEPPTLEYVRRLAQAGEKILAIKLYRTIHSVDLLDAKAAVEKLIERGREINQQVKTRPSNEG